MIEERKVEKHDKEIAIYVPQNKYWYFRSIGQDLMSNNKSRNVLKRNSEKLLNVRSRSMTENGQYQFILR